MKPSKKQFNLKKNNENDKQSQDIQSFFKTVTKTRADEENSIAKSAKPRNDDDRQFYIDAVKEKLDSCDGNAVCEYASDKNDGDQFMENAGSRKTASEKAESNGYESSAECAKCVKLAAEKNEWELKCKQEMEQRKELKKVYMNLNIRFSELYMKYDNLVKAATTNAIQKSVDSNDVQTSSDDVFTPSEVNYLRAMSLEKKNDCSFILCGLKYAYKSNLSELASRTLKGKAEWTEMKDDEEVRHEAKAPLTPKKVGRIKDLFIERISKCGIHSAEYEERMKDAYVNKMFAAGIRNLSKKFK